MSSKLPHVVIGRMYKPFDWFGWVMSIIGLLLLCKFGGIGWIFGTEKQWWMLLATVFFFNDYVIRVASGRLYKYVYFDTLRWNTYKLSYGEGIIYVSSVDEQHLKEYMSAAYNTTEYTILDKIEVESYIKREVTI